MRILSAFLFFTGSCEAEDHRESLQSENKRIAHPPFTDGADRGRRAGGRAEGNKQYDRGDDHPKDSDRTLNGPGSTLGDTTG